MLDSYIWGKYGKVLGWRLQGPQIELVFKGLNAISRGEEVYIEDPLVTLATELILCDMQERTVNESINTY